MSLRTGLRIRWQNVTHPVPSMHESSSLTSVAHVCARASVCVDAFVGYSTDPPEKAHGIVCLPPHAIDAAHALRQVGIRVDKVPLVLAWLPAHYSVLADACEVIEAAHVRIECVRRLGVDRGQRNLIALLCDNAELADQFLGAWS